MIVILFVNGGMFLIEIFWEVYLYIIGKSFYYGVKVVEVLCDNLIENKMVLGLWWNCYYIYLYIFFFDNIEEVKCCDYFVNVIYMIDGDFSLGLDNE